MTTLGKTMSHIDKSRPSSTVPVHFNSLNFWTACPYCFHLFEYPKIYEDCTLRCQNCSRAFHAVTIPDPPAAAIGSDSYFCCWSFFPLGFSVDISENNNNANTSSNWSPFSPMFSCPSRPWGKSNGGFSEEKSHNAKSPSRTRTVGLNLDDMKVPANSVIGDGHVGSKRIRVIIEDENDSCLKFSDPSEDSWDEWGISRGRRSKIMRGRPVGRRSLNKKHGGWTGHANPFVPAVKAKSLMDLTDRLRVENQESMKEGPGIASRETGNVGVKVETLDLNVT